VEVAVSESIRIAIEDPTQPAEARRVARKMAQEIGFDEVSTEKVAIVVTEACTNLLKHARQGEILIRITGEDGGAGHGLELLALDRGPGMSNLEQCLKDGYSTGTSPGQGLGAIMRLSNEADFYSVPGKGTGVLARWPAASHKPEKFEKFPRLRVGAVNTSKRGQEVCGDSWGTVQTQDTFTLLVADGLGHGPEANMASIEAVRMLHNNPNLPPLSIVELAHRALRSTRGAAVAVARVDRARGEVTFCGVGNISAQIYAGAKSTQHMVSVNGTAGHQTQRIREYSYPWPENGILVLHSDGLLTATGFEAQPGLALRDPSLIAGVLYRDFSRGQDDATVIIAKAA
jgi:anti-sigma regulatory factor (Ser/Thr protein kinase)